MRKIWFDEICKVVIGIGLGLLLGSLLVGCHANIASQPSPTDAASFALPDTPSAPTSNSPILPALPSTTLTPCVTVLATEPGEAKPSGILFVKWVNAPYWKRIDLETGEERVAGAKSKAVSPDGQWGAYMKDASVLAVKSLNGDGAEYEVSLTEETRTFEEAQQRISWVNDATLQIQLFERGEGGTRDRFVLVSPFRGETEIIELDDPKMLTIDEVGSIVAISPNLRELAYIASEDSGSAFQLVLWDRESQKALAIIPQSTPFQEIHWAPDGQRLAYLRWGGTGEAIVILDGKGKEWNAIEVAGGIDLITWSPDGKKLAFTYSNENDQLQLAVWKLETGELILPCVSILEAPILAWSPDSDYLAIAGMTKRGIRSEKYETFVWDLQKNRAIKWFDGQIGQLDWR